MISVITQAVQATSPTIIPYIVARILRGAGGAVFRNSIVIYTLELAHPSYRGPIVGLLQGFYLVGQLPGAFIPYGTSTLTTIGSWSWRIPLITAVFFPLVILLTCLFLPESPRWLIANSRREEAHVILVSV